MKTLILTTSIGGGHNACADAIAEELVRIGEPHTILDLYKYLSEDSLFGKSLKMGKEKGYSISLETLTNIPGLVRGFYDFNDKRKQVNEYDPSKMEAIYCAMRIREYIAEYVPDAIICTQVYAAQAVEILLEEGYLDCLTVGVITDYTVQVYWEDIAHFNWIVAANEELRFAMAKRSIQPNRMLFTGIPVKAAFGERLLKEQAKRKLGLSIEKPALLIMSGSMGYGHLEEALDELDALPDEFSLLVVCGNNEKLYVRIQAHAAYKKEMQLYAFTDQVSVMMSAAEFVITKPGGITTSEALAKGLPILVLNPIPGLESRNTEFLQNHGLAVFATKTYPLDEAVYNLLHNRQALKALKENCMQYGKPNAAADLCGFLQAEHAGRQK